MVISDHRWEIFALRSDIYLRWVATAGQRTTAIASLCATRRTRLISLRGAWRHFVLLSWLIAWLRTVLLGGAAILFFERFQNAFDPFAIVAAVGWRGLEFSPDPSRPLLPFCPALPWPFAWPLPGWPLALLRIARLNIAGTIAGLRLSVLRASILAALLSLREAGHFAGCHWVAFRYSIDRFAVPASIATSYRAKNSPGRNYLRNCPAPNCSVTNCLATIRLAARNRRPTNYGRRNSAAMNFVVTNCFGLS